MDRKEEQKEEKKEKILVSSHRFPWCDSICDAAGRAVLDVSELVWFSPALLLLRSSSFFVWDLPQTPISCYFLAIFWLILGYFLVNFGLHFGEFFGYFWGYFSFLRDLRKTKN